MNAGTLALLGTDLAIATTVVATAALVLTVAFFLFLALAPVVSSAWSDRLGATPTGEDFGLEASEAD